MNMKNIAILANAVQTINSNPRIPDVYPDTVAKPWYTSVGVLAMVAGMILAVATHFFGSELPPFMTKDNIVEFLVWFVPTAIGLYGRLTATKIITASAAKADVLNDKVGA